MRVVQWESMIFPRFQVSHVLLCLLSVERNPPMNKMVFCCCNSIVLWYNTLVPYEVFLFFCWSVVMYLAWFCYFIYNIAFPHRLLAAGKRCHAYLTEQPSVYPPKQLALLSNSASGWRVMLPHRGCEIIPVFSYGSAVERPTLGGRNVGLNPTWSTNIVLVEVINCMGFSVPPYYRTAVFGWVGVSCSVAWVSGSGSGWPSYYVALQFVLPIGAAAYHT